MRPAAICGVALLLVLVGCGGSSAPVVTPQPEATIAPAPSPTPPEESPDALPLLDSEVLLASDTGVLAQPGESVAIDHVVHNNSEKAHTMRFVVQEANLPVELSVSSFRLDAGDSFPVITTIGVPPDAEAGDVFSFELIAVQTEDVAMRATSEVRVLVAEPEGQRPSVQDTLAETETNERVVVYVLGPASDADDDLDTTSVRVLGGGFLGADVEAATDGTIAYRPFANVTGEDVVLYEICDDEGRCDSATLTIGIDNHGSADHAG